MKSNILFVSVLLLLFSCGNKEKKEQKTSDYNRGEITILTDDAFKSVTEALADAYMIHYPETNVKVEVQKEDLAFLDLLNRKTKLVVMSKELDRLHKSEYKRMLDLDLQPASFAADAVVFVVPNDSPLSHLSIDEIEKGLQSDESKFIFDGNNSGNLNFIAQKFNKKPSELKYSIINGNENVIKELAKYPNKIGVVSLNTISREYNEKAKELRAMVKILPIVSGDKIYQVENETLSKMTYPFTRVVYMLSGEGNFGIANGIIRFACTQKGQMVVSKEGLQPYYLYKREVEMK